MMTNDKTERIRSIIGWMRKNITLSLNGYRPGWENASKFSIGSSLPLDGDDTSAPSIGRVKGWPRLEKGQTLQYERRPGIYSRTYTEVSDPFV